MFTKPAADITFSDIEEFCREFGEGVRVEYKREIQHIPKIISSFANSSGGIFMIGVETDSTNQVVFPIQGIPKRSGIEEQIQQSALTGVYPAVIPEIVICDVPNTNNVVVIVRVDESPQAPMLSKILQEFISVQVASRNRMSLQRLTELNIC